MRFFSALPFELPLFLAQPLYLPVGPPSMNKFGSFNFHTFSIWMGRFLVGKHEAQRKKNWWCDVGPHSCQFSQSLWPVLNHHVYRTHTHTHKKIRCCCCRCSNTHLFDFFIFRWMAQAAFAVYSNKYQHITLIALIWQLRLLAVPSSPPPHFIHARIRHIQHAGRRVGSATTTDYRQAINRLHIVHA